MAAVAGTEEVTGGQHDGDKKGFSAGNDLRDALRGNPPFGNPVGHGRLGIAETFGHFVAGAEALGDGRDRVGTECPEGAILRPLQAIPRLKEKFCFLGYRAMHGKCLHRRVRWRMWVKPTNSSTRKCGSNPHDVFIWPQRGRRYVAYESRLIARRRRMAQAAEHIPQAPATQIIALRIVPGMREATSGAYAMPW